MSAVEYRSARVLTRIVLVLIACGALLAPVTLAVSAVHHGVLIGLDSSLETLDATSGLRLSLGTAAGLLFLTTAPLFLWWTFRAQRNVRALGATGLRVRPGWSIGFYFIPVVGLWKPVQAMIDLWRASHAPRGWSGVRLSPLVPSWWALFLAVAILGNAAYYAASWAINFDGIVTASYLQISSDLLNVPMHVVTLLMVGRIGRAQESAAEAGAEAEAAE